MENIKTIFIDWSKTISYDLFWGQLKTKTHPFHEYYHPIRDCLFDTLKPMLNPWMRGKYQTEDIVREINRQTNIPEHIIFSELQYSCENMQFCLPNLTELIQTIQKKGIKVVVATDNMDTFSRFTIPVLNLTGLFDGVLNSATLGVLKEDISSTGKLSFFEAYLHANNLTYDDVILLDDSIDKTGKYTELGFRRILIDSPRTLQETLESFR